MKYALIIANTEYTDSSLAQLSAPGKDAEEFARVLKDKEIGAFDDIKVLLNESQSIANEAIDDLFAQKRPDDLLLLYFSGHGIRDEIGSLYLAAKNTNHIRLRSTAIKSDFIREAMDQSRSKKQVVILDCCNSGAFAHGTKAAIGGSMGIASAFKGTGYGRIVLTASDSTQFAWEGDKIIGQETKNSLFTHFLIQGLEGSADYDDDGRITVDELYDYVHEQIINITPQQTPGKWSYDQKGEIVLCQRGKVEKNNSKDFLSELIEVPADRLLPFHYVLGAVTKVGNPRRKHEDRVYKGEIQCMGGNSLIVGIVADGIGSSDAGERGAQLAVDICVKYIKESTSDNIPLILSGAIESANKAVYEENQRNNSDGLTTLVVAIVYKNRCYIGNVGNSRAYWVQGDSLSGKILQITRDHSYYNMYGGIDSNSGDADILVNVIGNKIDIFVDLGFYLKGDNTEEARKRGLRGLILKPGDAIVLCSDGLISNIPGTNTPYATDDDIREALHTEFESDTAAIKMVSAALGRRPQDNVSAVTIQCLSEEVIKNFMNNKAANKRREYKNRFLRQLYRILLIAILIGLISYFIFRLFFQ